MILPQIITDIEETEQKRHWHLQKIRGTFRNYWDLSKYPFDRQELKIYLEEGSLEEIKMVWNLEFTKDTMPASRKFIHSLNPILQKFLPFKNF